MSARFPGAPDLDVFWRFLRDGVDAIREVPVARFDVDQFYDPVPGTPGKLSSRWGGFIDDIDRFDAAFFGISPREAARMDPQQRLALEAAWEALDDGGQRPLELRGTATGVFLGVHRDEYFQLAAHDAAEIDLLSVAGGARSGVAGRISYVLGLEGPSLVFDTDRSSSLVAVRAACESLRRGECSLALAGGVNLILAPETSLGFARAKMLAADGRIKFCDARADGIVRSDGVGMVALKPWSAARRDGDPVHAVILGAAINHDGGRSGDLMTPSSASQAALIRAACDDAGVSPHDVQYLEAHGTGTIVGDPVEVAAAAAVLQRGRDATRPLRIGSVKTNIGHAEAAAGIAGLIKVALAIQHRRLPASLHFATPNPRIAFEGIVVQAATTPWPDERKPLIAGVTSLGLTGVNAHVIVGEVPRDKAPAAVPEPADERVDERVEILAVSARGRVALAALACEYARILRGGDAPPVAALACAAALRRSHLEDRLAVVGATHDELARELEAYAGALGEAGSRGGGLPTALPAGRGASPVGSIGEAPARSGSRRRSRIAFVFPGAAGPRLGDLRALLPTEAAFHDSLLRCDAALRAAAGRSLLDEPDRDSDATLVTLEISLAALWRDWGVEPDAVVGTGVGDLAAAQVEGALSIEDAMLAVVRRTQRREPRDLPAVVGQLLDDDYEVFLEASPHPVALAAIAEQIALVGKPALAVGSLRHGEPARETLLRSLASLYVRGVDVAWRRLFAGTATIAVDLPRYPWQRERYWFARAEDPRTASHGVGPARDPSPPERSHRGDRREPMRDLDSIRDLVTRELARVLEIADAAAIDPRRGFRELGVTSLMTMELIGRLGSALGLSLPSSVVFNHPNVEALARQLARTSERPAAAPRARADRDRRVTERVDLTGDAPRSAGRAVGGSTPRALALPIAVVGMSCRFPGASDPHAFWSLLRGGGDAIREVPPERWDLERWYAPEPGRPGKMQTRWGGFLGDIDQFDAAFFGISPREAEEMDPQQRLVLEVAWEALERAGLAPDRLLGSEAGVFLGLMNTNDYAARKRLHDDPARIRAHHGTGIATSIAAGRLAYLLGSTGPAMAIDTACSSSLVAIHQAMRSLRSGECRLALAGGVNAILSPEITVAYSQAGMLSPTGRCRTFDASADGYVRSEGCGMLVLERLSDAVAGGRAVLAVLAGSAVNHAGRTSGLTAPNGNAQCAVIRAALQDAGLLPADVDYVEAHGTGTRLGDPIELHALAEVFRDRPRPLLVGSVKTNVGHLEAAAGVAGLIKVILALQHREIPPHLHLREHNPLLSAERARIDIPTRRTTWTKTGRRVAGVSSFGFSGSNAHVIVAEAPAAPAAARAETPAERSSAEIAVVSARTELALRAAAERHAAHLAAHPELAAGDVAFTLATGRTHHEHRLAVVAGSRLELIDALQRAARGDRPARSAQGVAARRPLAWLFTGQGAQRVGMGRELAAAWPVFARALDEAVVALDAHLDRRIADVMWADAGAAEAALLDETGHTQPALFAIEVALAALWRSWGVTPAWVAGHSIGELAAAHVAGVFSLDDAARLVAARARLMQALPRGGAMVAIAAPEADVAARIARHARTAAIAAVNGPAAVVISGTEAAVAEIAEDFACRGVRTSRLAVSHAFHSPLMEPMLEDFRAVAETVAYRPPALPGVGNLDGASWGPEVATAEYWVRHVRAPVRFADGVAALYRAGVRTFLELGPRPTLGGLVSACLPADAEVSVFAAMRAERPETEVALEALAGWYAAGGDVGWPGVFPDPRRRVELATYPWQHQRYWIAPPSPRAPVPAATPRGLLGARLSVAAADAVYEQVLSVEHLPWLADHRVDGEIVVPAAVVVEMFRAAAVAGRAAEHAAELRALSREALPPVSLRSLAFQAPLRLDEREPRRVQVVMTAEAIKLYSQADEAAPWILHAQAEAHDAAVPADAAIDLSAARARCAEPVDVAAAYAALDDVGLAYGPAFRGIRAAWRGPGEVLAHVIVPDGWPDDDHGAHPALVDAALQAVVAGAGGLYLPFVIERVQVLAAGATEAWVCVRYTTPAGEDTLGADVTLADPSGRAIAILSSFRARRAEPRVRRAAVGDAMYRLVWLPCETGVAAGPVRTRAARRDARSPAVNHRPGPAGPVANRRENRPPFDRTRRWAIVGGELAARVCAGLAARGAACTHVPPARIAEASAAEHVVWAWDDLAEDTPAAAQALAASGLAAAQALTVLTAPARARRVWWLTRGAVSIERSEAGGGDPDGLAGGAGGRAPRGIDLREQPRVAAATLWGIGRTLPLEHPELDVSLVDLPPGPEAQGAAVDAALGELAIDDAEREVAWRGGRRHAARLELAPAGTGTTRALGTGGTVLITGGLGGIGREVARHLARRGVGHLLLAGRRGAHTAGAAELDAELRGLGAGVTIAALDVTDRAAIAAVLAAIPAERPLRGIVHAAGVIDDGVLSRQTAARLAGVLEPKLSGAWHLDALTRDADLDAFVMFSSVAGTFGSAGQASYAAANAGLDALACHRRARGLPAVSLAWGPWDGVGMAASLDAAQRQRWEARGIKPLPLAHALALLDAAWGYADAQLVLAPLERSETGGGDPDGFAGAAGGRALRGIDLARVVRPSALAVPPLGRSLERTPAPAVRSTWLDELAATPEPQRAGVAIELVRGEVARLLALDGPGAIAADRPLATLGLDSLMALELRGALGRRAGASLPTTLAFDYPTVAAIGRYLVEQAIAPAPARPAPAAPPVQGAQAPGDPIADDPIAILGFGCRFPGDANDPDSFWRLLAGGVDAIREVPRERWDIDAYYDPDPGAPGKMYTRHGGFLSGIDRFDPAFFEISPREAVNMDPQQRLLLETSWEALERAGIPPGSLMDSHVGVFVGVMSHEYLALQGSDLERRDGYVTTGSLGSVASGRISYALGVRGPSMTIDTACSSSLVATHLACQALRAGECELALAGGATVVLTPSLFVEFSRLRGLSRDGRCKSFDAAADGVIWSEGCGVLVLKRLRDAQRDGDRVLAVIAGSAVNQDGRSQGLTAPSGLAQKDVIRRALASAKLQPADIDYVEAHGTGTRLGDPIEMQALGAVLQEGRDPARPVVVGSLKSNIGHAQAAAGVGGVIKTLLALEHEVIPPSLHFREPSPHIRWSELPVRVAVEAVAWPRTPERPRVAGISSFGISGTNAHLLLREAPPEPAPVPAPPRAAELLVVSARSDAALAQAASELGAYLRSHDDVPLGALAATLARGREHHPHRLAVVARSQDEAVRALAAARPGRAAARAGGDKLAWLFTGQGSQWPGMGRGLAADWPVFRRELDRICRALDAHLPRPLFDVMWGDGEDAELLDQTAYTQPALFALEVALAALWRSWGVRPDVLIGHSVGEIAAAHVAGVFTLDDAARLVTARGRLMQALPAGGVMVAVAAPEAVVADAVAAARHEVSIAVVNAPESVVISGAGAAVERIAASLTAAGARTARLAVSHAFHSPLMDPMLDDLRRIARSIRYRAPELMLVSNVSGAFASDEVRSADYWVEHVRRAVRFADGVRAARASGVRFFVELGPRPTLTHLARACLGADRSEVLAPVLIASAPRAADLAETAAALDALGTLHVHGAPIDWAGVFSTHGRGQDRVADLPTYPWQRGRYWVDPAGDPRAAAVPAGMAAGMAIVEHPLLSATLERPDGGEHLFTAELSLARAPWLADHRVHGAVVFPGTGFVELALAAGQRLGTTELLQLTLAAPLTLHAAVPVQLWVQGPDALGRRRFALYGRNAEDAWISHATGVLARPARERPTSPRAWPPERATPVDLTGLYDRLAVNGLSYGRAFRGLTALWRDGDELFARVELPEPVRPDAASYLLHPALHDAILHALPLLFPGPGPLLPLEWRDVALGASAATRLVARMKIDEGGGRASIEARDGAGELVLEVGELVLRRAPGLAPDRAERAASLFELAWEPITPPPPDGDGDGHGVVVGGTGALADRLGLPRVFDVAAVLAAGSVPPRRVIVDATVAAGDGDLLARVRGSVHRDLALLQGWLADERASDCELVWVTQGAIAAASNDASNDAIWALDRAPLWGLVRSARREFPRRGLRLLDVEATTTAARIAAALAAGASELAIRGAELRAPRLVPAVSASPAPATRWQAEGTTLVTGATGALGALVARHLVASYGARRLLLVSRQGAEAPGADALRDELTALGADVTLAACDAGSRPALAALLADLPADAPLGAVFHCAGVVDDGAISALTPARVDRVFGPKLAAAVHLHELTRTMPLERFVLFSSVSGVVGTAGQGNYAAANAFLDALAAHRVHAGLPGQSLAWGPWEPSGRGMTAGLTAVDLARLHRHGIAPLSAERGLALLDDALARRAPLLVPARLDLALLDAPAPRAAATLGAAGPLAASPAAVGARLAALAHADRQVALLELVRSEVAAVFRLPDRGVPDDQPLTTLGLDSLMAVELRDRLATRLSARLSATLAFDHPTPADMARFIAATLFPSAADEPAPRATAHHARGDRDLPMPGRAIDRRQPSAGGGDPDGRAGGAGVLPREIEELSNEELVSLVRSL